MEKVFAALERVCDVQRELLAKERELHAAISADDIESVRRLHAELAELFTRSDAASRDLRAQFERISGKSLH